MFDKPLGLIAVIEPILLLANSLFAFVILLNAYLWSLIWVNRLWGKYGLVSAVFITSFRLILMALIICLFNFSTIVKSGLKISPQIISTIVLGSLAGISTFLILTWKKLHGIGKG